MNELALFAGAGGGLLGTRLLGWRAVCYVEKDSYCIEVLKARIKDGYLDDAPIWDDVRTFDGKPWAGLVDVITAGFPCQPFSGAGLQLGERDERNMWPDTIRIIREVRPEWVLLENVSRLLSNAYIRRIFADLAEGGYDVRWDCIPACAVGANHQRDRVWIVGHAQSARDGSLSVQSRRQGQADSIDAYRTSQNVSYTYDERQSAEVQYLHRLDEQETKPWGDGKVRSMANTNSGGLQESKDKRESEATLPVRPNACGCSDEVAYTNGDNGERGRSLLQMGRIGSKKEIGINDLAAGTQWSVEPNVGRVAYGVAARVDRLRAIGNGQVPAVVRAAWMLLAEIDNPPR